MSRPCYQKEGYIIVENENKKKTYFTVINTNLKSKPHSHLFTFKQAKLIIHWCLKERIPNRYPYHMQESIKRLRPDINFDNEKYLYDEIKDEYNYLNFKNDYENTILNTVT